MTEKNKTILGLSISLIIFIFLFIIGFDTDVDSRIKRWTFGGDTLIGYFLIVIIRLSHSRVSPMSDLLNLTYYPLAITYLYFSWSKRKAIGNRLLNFIRNFYNKI